MARYPALDVNIDHGASELVLAIVDDYSPVALQESDDDSSAFTIFFSDSSARDSARDAVVRALPAARVGTRDVDDEDWARRSQENLGPISVGRITVAPPWSVATAPIPIVIQPSMGFGTGHHATTRLCLEALQTLPLDGTFVLDVGTGSGVLAIAARLLGARTAVGIDNDPDAITAARENLELNPSVNGVTFEVADLAAFLSSFDAEPHAAPGVILANLTGALLVRSAPLLTTALRSAGHLIVSGLLNDERESVVSAFSPGRLVFDAQEDGWSGLVFQL